MYIFYYPHVSPPPPLLPAAPSPPPTPTVYAPPSHLSLPLASLPLQELNLPVYRAHSPQIGMRRYFADLLAILSNRYHLCPTARHLAVYLLDLFMDNYDVAVKQLYVIALSCLLLASKSCGGTSRFLFIFFLMAAAAMCLWDDVSCVGSVPNLNIAVKMCNGNTLI